MLKQHLIILVTIFLFASCSTKNKKTYAKAEKVVITGKVRNYHSNKKEITVYVNHIGFSSEILTSKLDSLGHFSVSFKSYTPTDVWIQYVTNFMILIHPGDSIHVEFDGNTSKQSTLLNTITFNGNAVKSNHDAAIFQQMYYSSKPYDNENANNKAIKEYEADDYTLYLDTLQQKSNDLYTKFVNDLKPNEETKSWVLGFINEKYTTALLWYPTLHRGANQFTFNDWDVPLSYYDPFLKFLPLTKSMFISGLAVSRITNSSFIYVQANSFFDESNKKYRTTEGSFSPSEISDSLTIYDIIKYTSDPLRRQVALTDLFVSYMEYSSVDLFEKYRAIADKYIVEPFLKEPLLKQYNQVISDKKNNPIVQTNEALNDTSNLLTKQLIDSIKSANKGKVIYVDCWATWCKPCRTKMPYVKELMLQLEGKEVAFVFLCFESRKSEWKKAIADLQLSGQHILLNKEQSKNIRTVLNFKGVSHHFIMDKNGKIVANSERIGYEQTKDKIETLLLE